MAHGGLTDRLEAQVVDAASRCGIARGGLLVVAVSGGPDSLALLHALARSRPVTSLEIHAAHLDHGLRGEESRADAAFVSRACRRAGAGPHLRIGGHGGLSQRPSPLPGRRRPQAPLPLPGAGRRGAGGRRSRAGAHHRRPGRDSPDEHRTRRRADRPSRDERVRRQERRGLGRAPVPAIPGRRVQERHRGLLRGAGAGAQVRLVE